MSCCVGQLCLSNQQGASGERDVLIKGSSSVASRSGMGCRAHGGSAATTVKGCIAKSNDCALLARCSAQGCLRRCWEV